jgi:hypothetical protein
MSFRSSKQYLVENHNFLGIQRLIKMVAVYPYVEP